MHLRKAKKIIAMTLLLAMALCFCGCGKSDEAVVVEYLINQIGTVTLDSKQAIVDAKDAYDKLPDADKKTIENYDVLSSAENQYAELEKEQKELEAKRQAEEKSKIKPPQKVKPAPISISNMRLGSNSIGTPEVFVQFTNIGSETIEVFDFFVRCYDKYGEVVMGYGRYEYSDCYYDTDLPSGSSTPSDWRWTLYGFDAAASFEVAVTKYKLQGEAAVEIPENQLKWWY